MSADEPVFSARNRWFTTSVGVTALLAVLALLAGFIGLPMLQVNGGSAGVWDAICNAAGLVRPAPNTASVIAPPRNTVSTVAADPRLVEGADAEAIGRGATLALRCTMCHGARGLSDANSPNLAGQYPFAIYKQLEDFKSGVRPSAVMAPLVVNLSDQDMRDLAAYYAYLPRLPPDHPATAGPAPAIVVSGAPMRGIAPCGACHGGLDNKLGSAWLDGQPQAYLQAQLTGFASGARHNDINEQMRNIARQMTADEIAAASAYYGVDLKTGKR